MGGLITRYYIISMKLCRQSNSFLGKVVVFLLSLNEESQAKITKRENLLVLNKG